MAEIKIKVATKLDDLLDLQPGTRIVTATDQYLLAEHYGGRVQWYEPGQLENYQPSSDWLPTYILPMREDEDWENAGE